MTGNTAPLPGVAPAPAARDLAATAHEEPTGAAAEGAEAAEGEGQADPDLAWRLGIVAKKDREARARATEAKAAEARVKDAEARLAAREKAIADREKQDEDRRAKWRRDPKALLTDNGFVPEAALQYMLNGEKLTPDQQLAATMEERLAAERSERQAELDRLREEQTKREQDRDAERQRQEEEAHQAREQEAIAELNSDIGEIVAGDPKTYRLISKAGERGISAIFGKVQELSNKQLEETGRRPQLTTRLLERAAAEIEQAARKELQETMADPELAEAIGLHVPAPRAQARPNTLTNTLPNGNAKPQPERQETEQQRRERVKAHLDDIFRRRAAGR